MNSSSALPSTPEIAPSLDRLLWLVPVVFYILAMAVTTNPYFNDSPYYANDIARFYEGTSTVQSFTEFGHLLWRPIGYWLTPLFIKVFPDSIAPTLVLKILRGLVLISMICGLIAAVLMYQLCSWLMRSKVWALLPVFIFLCANSVLAHCQSGTSYIPGVTCVIFSLWLQAKSPKFVLPGVFLALAAVLWFPYALAVPAACCFRKFCGLPGTESTPWQHPLSILLVYCGISGPVILAGAFIANVRTPSELMTWITSASHGFVQSRNLIRAIGGIPRLILDLADDGIYLKRFTFHDPYNPVTLFQLLKLVLWKIAAFYLFIGSVVVLGLVSKRGRNALLLLSIVAFPMLFFAIVLLEPSSAERFLPVYPFLVLAFAAGWGATSIIAGLSRSVIIGFAVVILIVNWPTFSRGAMPREESRLEDFRKFSKPGDAMVVSHPLEPLVGLAELQPFHRLNLHQTTKCSWLPTNKEWRQVFAKSVLVSWQNGHEVWITKDVLLPTPTSGLNWVEGDKPDLHWKDVYTFFKTLEFDATTERPDGFQRLDRAKLPDRMQKLSTGAE